LFLVYWWYFYYWASFTLSFLILPVLVSYLESADFTFRGRLCFALKSQIPYYIAYFVAFIGLVCFLYWSDKGRTIVNQGGGLVGVLMGMNITFGLCFLALTLGYGIVKIPIETLKSSKLKKRYEYIVY